MTDIEEHYLVVTLKPAGRAADVMVNAVFFEFEQFKRFKCAGFDETGAYINTLQQPFLIVHTLSIMDLFAAAHPDRMGGQQ